MTSKERGCQLRVNPLRWTQRHGRKNGKVRLYYTIQKRFGSMGQVGIEIVIEKYLMASPVEIQEHHPHLTLKQIYAQLPITC